MKQYKLFPRVTEEGFANTGLTAAINDRDTKLIVPWEAAHKSVDDMPIDIEWRIKSEDGHTYRVIVPVLVKYNSSTGESTATYRKGTYAVNE
jgi:hypothetical protein